MIIRLTNTIGAIGRRLGIVTKNLQMWLGFYKSDVIGKELVVNGDFATDSDWTKQAGWTISGGVANVDSSVAGSTNITSTNLTLTIGSTYDVEYYVDSASGIGVASTVGGVGESVFSIATGNRVRTIVATSTQGFILSASGSTTLAQISNITVKEVTQFVKDKSTNSNDAKLFTGKALEFNGNDYVSLGSKNTSVGNLTATAWVELSDLTGVEAIFSYGDFLIRTNGSDINVWSDVSAPPATFSNVMTTSITRLVTTITGTSVSLYLNGVLSATQSIVALSSNSRASYIGSFNAGNFFSGNLSDIQLYDEAWDSDDALFDYNNPNHLVTDNPNTTLTLSNLSAYYALSEGSGSKIYDSTGLGAELNDGTWNANGGWSVTDGVASNDGSGSTLTNDILTVDKSYRVTIKLATYTSGIFSVFLGSGTESSTFSGLDEFAFTSNCLGDSNMRIKSYSGIGSLLVDSISVKEVKSDDGTSYDGTSIGATWVDQQPTIPQLGLMDWSKGSNLYLFSEPTVDEGSAIGATYESFTWGNTSGANFTNCVRFGDNSVDRYRYGATVTSSVDATLSCYVIMDDLSEPNVGQDSSSGDFSIVIGGTVGAAITVTSTSVGGNVWRISKTRDTTTTLLSNNGIVKYTTQSAKGFRVVGWQIEESLTPNSFIGTNGSAASNATLIQNPNDLGKDVLGNSLRLRERGFNLDGSGYAEVVDDSSWKNSASTIQFWIKNSDNNKFIIFSPNNSSTQYICFRDIDGLFLTNSGNGGDAMTIVMDSNLTQTSAAITEGNWHMFTISNVNLSTWSNFSINKYNSAGFEYGGIIDEVVVYDRTLTSKEITNNYKVGLNAHKVGSAFSTEFSSEFGF